MKRVKRTIRIEVETERSYVVSRQKSSGWCPSCNAKVDLDLEKAPDCQAFICLGSAPNTEELNFNNQIYLQHPGHSVRKEEEQ